MNVLDRLSEEGKKEFWASLALRYAEGMTPRLLAKILRSFQSAYAAYEAFCSRQPLSAWTMPPPKISSALRGSLKNGTWRKQALDEWQQAQKTDCEVVLWNDYRFPLALKRLPDAPPFFYAKGCLSLLSCPTLAIVGARKPSSRSLERAYAFAAELSSLGLCIVSGMALGVDKAAHEGALHASGKTIAVLGTGVNVVYPVQHKDLYARIAEQGLIISEFSPFSKPLAQNFPIRNRLITGVSEGVLIVEAALKSGSLITARLALEQNKNVYVCRPQHEKHSLGCQKLLEEGAMAAEDCQTVVADLVPDLLAQYEALKCRQESHAAQTDAVLGEVLPHLSDGKCFGGSDDRQADGQAAKNTAAVSGQIETLTDCGGDSGIYRQETADKRIKTAFSGSFCHRPKFEDDLEPMQVDFGSMAREILQKKTPHISVSARPAQKAKTASDRKFAYNPAELTVHTDRVQHGQADSAVCPAGGNAVLGVLHSCGELCADEILQNLQKQGAGMDMAELSAELLMLEMDGSIEKIAGGRYRVCYG